MSAADDFDTDACAALDFEEIADEELLRQFHAAPWTEECFETGVTLRLAAITLGKTKAKLIEAMRTFGQDHYFEWLDRLKAQEERFTQLAELLRLVQARLVVAGSAIVVEGRTAPVPGFRPNF